LEKIDKLLQKEDKIDTLINMSEEQLNSYLRMRGNEKDESTRMLNEHITRIDHLTERMDTLCTEPLAFRRPLEIPGSQNLEDQGHQEIPKIIFSRNTHKFQDKDYQKFKKELQKYDDKDHRGFVVWINKMDSIFESNPLLGEREKVMTTSNCLEGEAYDRYRRWSKKCDARSFHWHNCIIKKVL
jgi:hypothetical protein